MRFSPIQPVVNGHELTHGFDDQGRKFDGDGNLHDWWTADDSREYERRSQCIADEYSGFEATEGVKLNGKLTLGENTADNGGLRIALMALESTLPQQSSHTNSNGLTPQQEFFISYAETWCSNATPQYLTMMAKSNPHATAKARAMGWYPTCRNSRKPSAARRGSRWYNCPDGSEICRIIRFAVKQRRLEDCRGKRDRIELGIVVCVGH